MENLKLYKECETCQGDAYVIVNGTPNDDPQFDEREDCIYCDNGLVGNNEVIQDRLTEYDYLIRQILEQRQERINREQDLIYKIEQHQYRLRNKLSNQ